MKSTIKAMLLAMVTFSCGLLTTSCDPCEDVTCTNGYCSNGICICTEGYEKVNGKCVAINGRHVGENLVGVEIIEGSMYGPPDTQAVVYTIVASDTDPKAILLKDYANLTGHDIKFTANPLNRNEFIEDRVWTIEPLPVLYEVSGFKDDSKIQLNIRDVTLDSAKFPQCKVILQY